MQGLLGLGQLSLGVVEGLLEVGYLGLDLDDLVLGRVELRSEVGWWSGGNDDMGRQGGKVSKELLNVMGVLPLVGSVEVLGGPNPQVDPFVVRYGCDSRGCHGRAEG